MLFSIGRETVPEDVGEPAVMANEKVILATLDRVYEAAVDTARWPDAVRALRDLFGAAGACVFAMDSRTHQVPLWIGMGMEAGEKAYR